MKLINNVYYKPIFKGAIILFLFLHFVFSGNAQKYSLKILPEQNVLKNILKKRTFTKTYTDSALVYSELQKMQAKLFSDGYLSASFDSVIFDSLLVKAYLFIGKKYQIKELYIKGLYPLLQRKYGLQDSTFDTENPVTPVELPLLYENIVSEYENSGYPFAALIPEGVAISDSLINLKLKLQKNDLYRFNKIIIKGKAKISQYFIRRYLSVYEGDVYNEAAVSNIDKKIGSLSYCDIIRPPEVDFYDHKADLYLYLKPKKANLINGVAGFIPDKENDNKLVLTGNMDLNLLNNFGKGENIFLKWTRTAKLSQKLNAGFVVLYVFKSPFSLRSQFNIDKRDSSFMKISGKFGIDFNFKNNDRITAFTENKQSLLLSNVNSDTSIFKSSKTLLFGFSYQSEHYDYRFNPLQGYFFNASFAGGNRTLLADKKIYYEADLNTEYYIPVYRHFVLKLASNTKYAFPDSDLYQNELFDLGGYNTLKGFDENRFQTSAYSVFTVEQRYLFEQNSNMFVFFNIAGMKDYTEARKINIPYGFGAGTNVRTKAGIFSISYALGTLRGTPLQFSDSKIHIGYINRF